MKDNFTISEETIQKILQKNDLGQFSSLEEIKTGLINPVFILNHQYILRINTKGDTANKQRFEREAFLYTLLSHSDIPTPTYIAYDCSGEIINEDYILLSYIEGETLTEAFRKASKEIRYRLAFQLGQIAKRIHSVDSKALSPRSDLFGLKEDWKSTEDGEFTTFFIVVKQRQLLSEKIIGDIEEVSKAFFL